MWIICLYLTALWRRRGLSLQSDCDISCLWLVCVQRLYQCGPHCRCFTKPPFRKKLWELYYVEMSGTAKGKINTVHPAGVLWVPVEYHNLFIDRILRRRRGHVWQKVCSVQPTMIVETWVLVGGKTFMMLWKPFHSRIKKKKHAFQFG